MTLLYSLVAQPLQFWPLGNVTTPVGEGLAGDGGSEVLHQLPAGNRYVFEVVSSNAVGSSSALCPPVTHDIGIYSYTSYGYDYLRGNYAVITH